MQRYLSFITGVLFGTVSFPQTIRINSWSFRFGVLALLFPMAVSSAQERGVLPSPIPPPACSDTNATGPSPDSEDSTRWNSLHSRHKFARAMSRIEEGMTEQQVHAILGPPDDIRTQSDPAGISTDETEKIWRYGTAGQLTTATLGRVFFDENRNVQHVVGKGTPPPVGMFPEGQLRHLIQALDVVPNYHSGSRFNPRYLIRAVNLLQPLGKKRALAAMEEYYRISFSPFAGRDTGREGLWLVLRVLFDVPNNTGFMPSMHAGAPLPTEPANRKQLPRFPIVMAGDIPFLVVSGYRIGGEGLPVTVHLEYFRKQGVLRREPLSPSTKPLREIARLTNSPEWPFRDRTQYTADPEYRVRHRLQVQALRLLETVYPVKPEENWEGLLPFGKEGVARRRAILREASKLPIRWDTIRHQFSLRERRMNRRRSSGRGAVLRLIVGLADKKRRDRSQIAEQIVDSLRAEQQVIVRKLIPYLQDDDDSVRYSVAVALGHLGSEAKEAVPALLAALADRANSFVSKDSASGILVALDRIDPQWRNRPDIPACVRKRWLDHTSPTTMPEPPQEEEEGSRLSLEASAEATHPITNAKTVLAIYTEDHGIASRGEDRLILGVCGDGHLVWSEDRTAGGPPYRTATIDPVLVSNLLSSIEKDGLFANKAFTRANFGPDAEFTTIYVRYGKRLLQMQSWHELAEADQRRVATSQGIQALQAHSRMEVLARETPAYLLYRLAWSNLRLVSDRLISQKGTLVDGNIATQAGGKVWVERPSNTLELKGETIE